MFIVFALAGLVAPRLRVAGLSAAERSLVASSAREAAGSAFEVLAVPSARRVVIFDGLSAEADGWLLEAVAESLDAAELPPVLVTAGPASLTPDDAVDAHVRRWGLREPLACRPTAWRPADARCARHVVLDGAMLEHPGVPAWYDVSSVVVLDGVVDEPLRAALLALLGGEGWEAEEGADEALWERGTFNDAASGGPSAARANGWGLRPEALEALCADEPCPPAVLELQSRIVALVREANEGAPVEVCRQSDAVFGGSITPLAANAPVASDGEHAFSWHIDADPMLLPPSPWTDAFGRYPNRLPGKPRFVTALCYLSPSWRDEWGAHTRFLDTPSGEVLTVEPSPGRVVLMDMDLTHALSAPSVAAGARPRYSLALKLVLHPRGPDGASGAPPLARLAPAVWGEPERFGSAWRQQDPAEPEVRK